MKTIVSHGFFQYAAMAVIALSSWAHAATTTTATVSSGTTFNVASSPLGGIAGCEIVPGSHSYGTSSFTTGAAATYSFKGTGYTGTLSDPFLAIYQGTFDPANPTTNLVGCNDDESTSDRMPRFSAALSAGTTYVMVVTSYGSGAQNGTVTFSSGIEPTLTLASLSTYLGATGQSMVAASNSSAAITYSISNPNVATIHPSTGALTLLTAGSAVVTATQAPEAFPGQYDGHRVTATLTVSATPPPTPTSIPTLSEWGQIILVTLMALGCGLMIRRRR